MTVEVREVVNVAVVLSRRTDSMAVLEVWVYLRQKEYRHRPGGIPHTVLGTVRCPEDRVLIEEKILVVEQYVEGRLEKARNSPEKSGLSRFSLSYSEIKAAIWVKDLPQESVTVDSEKEEFGQSDEQPDQSEIPAHLDLTCWRCGKTGIVPATWKVILLNGKALRHRRGRMVGKPILNGNFLVFRDIEVWCRKCQEEGLERFESFSFEAARWRFKNHRPSRQLR